VCQEFGVAIIEDDPYYYLQHDGTAAGPGAAGAVATEGPMAALEPCAEVATVAPADVWRGLGRSFLSLDVDGRVIRLDSFSKIVAPGFRLGWITAAPHVVRAYNGLAYCGSQNGSSLSMVVLGRLLETWGDQGFAQQITRAQSLLRRRSRALVAAVRAECGDLVDFAEPKAGLFLWVTLKDHMADGTALASFPSGGAVEKAMAEFGVVVLPGRVFAPFAADDSDDGCSSVASPPATHRGLRLSFVGDEAAYSDACRRLRGLILLLCSQGAVQPPGA